MGYVWVQPIDETLVTEGLWLEGIEPGELSVAVELGGEWAKRKRTVLAREELSLAAGETRELVLTLTDPPEPPERVTLGGVVSFPYPSPTWDELVLVGRDGSLRLLGESEETVRLQFYQADWGGGDPDVELSLADMVRVDGALPTWSFRLEDIPVGACQIHLLPFLKSWMIDVPAGGRDDVALVIPELAEVRVETVDARTGERIPLEKLRYIHKEEVPGRMHQIWSDQIWTGFEGEPGLFRLWTAARRDVRRDLEDPERAGLRLGRQGPRRGPRAPVGAFGARAPLLLPHRVSRRRGRPAVRRQDLLEPAPGDPRGRPRRSGELRAGEGRVGDRARDLRHQLRGRRRRPLPPDPAPARRRARGRDGGGDRRAAPKVVPCRFTKRSGPEKTARNCPTCDSDLLVAVMAASSESLVGLRVVPTKDRELVGNSTHRAHGSPTRMCGRVLPMRSSERG